MTGGVNTVVQRGHTFQLLRKECHIQNGSFENLKIKKCRICLVETGPHNVRHRTKLQYHICNVCEDMEDKERRKKLKMHVLNHYGGKCICCGTSIMEFLSMDHINGDGYIDRRLGDGDHIWNRIKRDNYPGTFQILCFNCHMARTHYGYCPHAMLNNRRRRKQLLLTVFKDTQPGLLTNNR